MFIKYYNVSRDKKKKKKLFLIFSNFREANIPKIWGNAHDISKWNPILILSFMEDHKNEKWKKNVWNRIKIYYIHAILL